jgi:hypothetical protein
MRVRLVYVQFAAVAVIAETKDDLLKPSEVILRVVHAVTTDKDASGVDWTAVNAAAAEQGLPLSMEQRSELLFFLKKLADLDHAACANGFAVLATRSK